jgi:hypothetical protein
MLRAVNNVLVALTSISTAIICSNFGRWHLEEEAWFVVDQGAGEGGEYPNVQVLVFLHCPGMQVIGQCLSG